MGRSLRTAKEFQALQQTWQYLNIELARQISQPSFSTTRIAAIEDLHTKLITKTRELISQVGDTSNLILDPDLDSHYLIDAVLLKLPEAQELLANLRFLGEDIIRRQTLTPEGKGQLIMRVGVAQANSDAVRKGMNVAFSNNPSWNLRPILQTPLRDSLVATQRFLDEMDQTLIEADSVPIQYSAAEFDRRAIAALSKSFDLWQATIKEIDGLLQSRIDHFHQKIYQVTAFVLIVVAAISYVFIAFSYNLSAQRRANRRLNAQHAATRALADATTLQEAAPTILKAICNSMKSDLKWEVGKVWWVDEPARVLSLVATWHQSSMALTPAALTPNTPTSDSGTPDSMAPEIAASESSTFALGVGLPGQIWQQGEPVWIANLSDCPDCLPRIALPQGMRSVSGFPIYSGDTVRGVMLFFSRKAYKPDADLLKMMAAIGSQIGQFIQRQKTEEALRQGETLQRMALSAASMGTWDWNIRTGEEHWSTEVESIFGLTSGSFSGNYEEFFQYVHPSDRKQVLRSQRRALREGADYVPEYRIIRPDGSIRWVTVHGKVLHDANGKPIRLSGVTMDITERKQSEAALREREERFSSLLSNISGAVYRCAYADGWTMEFISEPIQEITGYAADAFIRDQGLTFAEIALVEDEARIQQELNQAIAEQQSYMLEYRIRHADGSIRWVYEKGQGIFNAKNDLVCLDGVIFDITDRKHAEERLRLLESVVVNTNDSVVIFQASQTQPEDLKIVYVNQAFTRMTGYSLDEIIDKPPAIFYGEKTDLMKLMQMQAAIARCEAFNAELIKYRQDGSQFWVEFEMVPIAYADGTYTHWISVQRDTSDRKQAEDALLKSKEAAEEASRAKSQFLANMSHELRTPLNAIIGYSEILQEDSEDLGYADMTADLEKIRGAGKHLLGLINDILDISKIEAGKMDLYLETFELEHVIFEVESTIQPLIKQNHNTLNIICSDNLGSMHADLTKLRQALFNLLSNAAKFTENGTITLAVTRGKRLEEIGNDLDNDLDNDSLVAHSSSQKDWITFGVTDTGIGMSLEQMSRVFQAFTQADASTTRKYGGTGLGLAISRHFCQMMGGDITVRSEVGNGSTFTICLPVELDNRAESPATEPCLTELSIDNILPNIGTIW
ncbi:MAG: PAS domain-containing protein [Leptolyngbyaceae cyanobacterium CRU_2_3]|nr:PAS domain-containing protein [Leptolyngbyaceae cyanobacterium CRU_2_3]